jgi:hypothetical protein
MDKGLPKGYQNDTHAHELCGKKKRREKGEREKERGNGEGGKEWGEGGEGKRGRREGAPGWLLHALLTLKITGRKLKAASTSKTAWRLLIGCATMSSKLSNNFRWYEEEPELFSTSPASSIEAPAVFLPFCFDAPSTDREFLKAVSKIVKQQQTITFNPHPFHIQA